MHRWTMGFELKGQLSMRLKRKISIFLDFERCIFAFDIDSILKAIEHVLQVLCEAGKM